MEPTINRINNYVQNIFDELSLLESLAVLLKNYYLNSNYDNYLLSDKLKKAICFERCNCVNIAELVIETISKIKDTGENLEKNVFSLNQYTNNSGRQITTEGSANQCT